MNATQIKLDILKLQGIGLNKREIVKDLSRKYGVSQRTVYYHLEHKSEWLSDFIELDKAEAYYDILAKLDYIYKQTMLLYFHAREEAVKLGCLNSLRNTLRVKAEMQGLISAAAEPQQPQQVKYIIELADPAEAKAQ